MDLSCGASFTFTIGPNLPPFTFKVIPDVREPVDGFPASTVREVEVFRGDSSQPLQLLSGCDLSEMEPPPSATTDPPWFHPEDINFDGFQDIYLMTNWGATGNQSGCVWIFHPLSDGGIGHFEYSTEFSELGRHWLDPATKTILSLGVCGMAGTIYNASKYGVERDRPVLIYSEAQDYDPGKNQYHCVVREQRGNTMSPIRDQWADIPPCNPQELNRQYVHPGRVTSPGTTVRVIG